MQLLIVCCREDCVALCGPFGASLVTAASDAAAAGDDDDDARL